MNTETKTENKDSADFKDSSSIEKTIDFKNAELIKQFYTFIPEKRTYSIKGNVNSKRESEEKINEANKSAEDKIVDAYVKSENSKLSQQKPIAIFVLIIFTIQLLAFNTIMFFIVIKGLSHFDSSNFLEIINFLKYYVGAVVVELIALVTIIVKGSFTLKANSIVEQIIKRKKL